MPWSKGRFLVLSQIMDQAVICARKNTPSYFATKKKVLQH
jgi:hypothetical protein